MFDINKYGSCGINSCNTLLIQTLNDTEYYTAKMLIELGADVNKPSLVCPHGNIIFPLETMTELLITMIKNNDILTEKELEMIDLLLKHDANPDFVYHNNYTYNRIRKTYDEKRLVEKEKLLAERALKLQEEIAKAVKKQDERKARNERDRLYKEKQEANATQDAAIMAELVAANKLRTEVTANAKKKAAYEQQMNDAKHEELRKNQRR